VKRFPSTADFDNELFEENGRRKFLYEKQRLLNKIDALHDALFAAEKALRRHLLTCTHPPHHRTPIPVLRDYFYANCQDANEYCHDCLEVLGRVPPRVIKNKH